MSEALYEEDVAVNPREFEKIAPVLGILIIIAVVVYVVGKFLL